MKSKRLTSMAELGLNATDVRVLDCIGSKTDEQGVAWLSFDNLGELAGLSRRRIASIIKRIKQAGLISYYHDHSIKKNCITVKDLEPVKVETPKPKPKPTEPTNGGLNEHRLELFKKLQDEYNHDRAYIQIPSAMTAFQHECKSVARQYAQISAKNNAIEGMFRKLIGYVRHLKTTDTWTREGGKYIPGINTLIRNGKWKVFVERPVKKVSSEKEALRKMFRS